MNFTDFADVFNKPGRCEFKVSPHDRAIISLLTCSQFWTLEDAICLVPRCFVLEDKQAAGCQDPQRNRNRSWGRSQNLLFALEHFILMWNINQATLHAVWLLFTGAHFMLWLAVLKSSHVDFLPHAYHLLVWGDPNGFDKRLFLGISQVNILLDDHCFCCV